MSSDSDLAEIGRDMKYIRKRKRELYGVPCPRCQEQRPKAQPKILLPGQKCFDGYRDPRPKLTQEQIDAIWTERGYTRMDAQNIPS